MSAVHIVSSGRTTPLHSPALHARGLGVLARPLVEARVTGGSPTSAFHSPPLLVHPTAPHCLTPSRPSPILSPMPLSPDRLLLIPPRPPWPQSSPAVTRAVPRHDAPLLWPAVGQRQLWARAPRGVGGGEGGSAGGSEETRPRELPGAGGMDGELWGLELEAGGMDGELLNLSRPQGMRASMVGFT